MFVIGEAQGCESISALLSDDGTAFPRNVKINPKEDVVALPFSSGTTGISKGVMITHYNLIAQIRLLFKDGPPLEDVTTVLNVLPFYHIYGLAIILGGRLYIGSKLVVLSRFEPLTFLQAIQDYKVCFIVKFKTTIESRLHFPERTRTQEIFSAVICTGANA